LKKRYNQTELVTGDARMRRKISVWLMCGILLLSALSGAARALGREQPMAWQAIFTTPEGAPCSPLCLFGVIPAKHTPQEALALLSAHPITRTWTRVSDSRFEARRDGYTLAVSFSLLADGVLDTVTLSIERTASDVPERALIQLGDVLSRFGAPDYLHLSAQTDPLLVYLSRRLLVSARIGADRRLAPELPIKRLTLFRFGICPSSAPLYTFLAWRGLTHQARQLASAPVQRYVRRIFGAQVTLVPC
jgi:hypothetical protein